MTGTSRSPARLTLGLALILGALALAPASRAQGTAAGPGVDREAMWPAPTAEDWERPVLIRWQRTWEDALAVSRETGKPIMICVNMDGEIASEHYAGLRYREPGIAALYEPYVCVIASVYRHNPRDFDEQGRRIECPRFGTVTCGEHISIEPGLFEQYFEGKRIAPRHIGVELDGQENYDVYYAWDTASVFQAIRDGAADREIPPLARGDRSLPEQVASRDELDREEMERLYIEGTREQRRVLIEAAVENPDAAPNDLLRLAVFGLDLELNRLARQALANATTESSIPLIAAALRVPMDSAEREALIVALERLGETWPRARTLGRVHRGLASRSDAVDEDGWSAALGGERTVLKRTEVESRLAEQDAVLREGDADAKLALAEAFIAYARELPARDADDVRLLFMDARNTALEAESLGAYGWRVDAAVAIGAYYGGDTDEAYERAASAMAGGAPYEGASWNAMATLAIFAQSRYRAIAEAVRAGDEWPPEWLTDIHAACSVLARHPESVDEHVVAYYDFLRWLGADEQADRALDQALERFPDSAMLHARLRRQILWEHGVDGLRSVYDSMLAGDDATPALEWFAGYAAFQAAEIHRNARDEEQALESYGRALEAFDRYVRVQPDARDNADHYAALSLAGRARIAFENDDDDGAVADLVAALERSPEAAGTLDGLNLSPADTVRMVRARLTDRGRTDLLEVLQGALRPVDPALLELPAYENALPDDRPRAERNRVRRRPGPGP